MSQNSHSQVPSPILAPVKNCITYLALDEMSDSCLRHYGNRHALHDLLDHLWVRHTGHATLGSDIGRYALEGHDGGCASFFSDAGLLVMLVSGICELVERNEC